MIKTFRSRSFQLIAQYWYLFTPSSSKCCLNENFLKLALLKLKINEALTIFKRAIFQIQKYATKVFSIIQVLSQLREKLQIISFENNNISLLNVNHSKMPLSSLRNSFRRKNKPQKLKVTEDSLFENSQDKQAQVRSFQYTCLENAEICKCYIRLNRCCLYLLFRLKSQISIIQWLHFELILLVYSFTMS